MLAALAQQALAALQSVHSSEGWNTLRITGNDSIGFGVSTGKSTHAQSHSLAADEVKHEGGAL